MASIYGAVCCVDPRLLATAANLRYQWADEKSASAYPINLADAETGPLLGRYPGDTYDGDLNTPAKGHPWALCTANFAELYYRVASAILQDATVLADPVAAPFFNPLRITEQTEPGEASQILKAAGDRMLQALIRHSDHLALSEQFDAETGFEKSVRDLSWSYAAFLSAVRARARIAS